MAFLPPWAYQDLRVEGRHFTFLTSVDPERDPRHHQKQQTMRTFEFGPLKPQHSANTTQEWGCLPEPISGETCFSRPLSHSLSWLLCFSWNFHPKPKALRYSGQWKNKYIFKMEQPLKMKNNNNKIPVTVEGPWGQELYYKDLKCFIEMYFTHCMIHLFKVYTEFSGF